MLRTAFFIILLGQISGCVIVPPVQMAQKFDFNAPLPEQPLIGYEDLLCCASCTA